MARRGEHAAGPMVLVVDDDKGLLRLIEKALQREGFSTSTASSGCEAISRLSGPQPDLMLLDLKLHDFEGRDLINRLAEIKQSVPFIIITGQGDEQVAVEMMKRGAMDYLVKDAGFLQFVPEVVRRALAQLERERKLAAVEEDLKKEHAFISAVLDTSGALVVVLDREGRVVRFNRAGEQITGRSFGEVQGGFFWELFLAPEQLDSARATFRELCESHGLSQHENSLLTKQGERRWIAWSMATLSDASGAVEYIIGTGIDVTERKRLEKEILEISELEQRRIGQDLHDGLCQQLAGIELMSQALEQKLAAKSRAEAVRAGEIARHVRESIAHTRSLARGLSPVELDANGLMAALQEMATNVGSIFGIECALRCDVPVLVYDNAVATHLFRIAQEAVSNSIKHGKATRIEIALTALPERIMVAVRDNGAGFSKVPGQGMGLRIMKYRAGVIGGSLAIQKEKAGGTTVVCSVRRSATNSLTARTA